MNITRIGFGAWAIGGIWKFGWGAQDDRDSMAVLHRALDSGINWIDTAAVYGLGHSEEVVGKVLKERTDKPYVFTKCSLVWNDNGKVTSSMKAESVRKEAENSLRRLGVDVLDLYQIHWPNPDAEIEEGWETLEKLKEEGKIRYAGVSNFSVSQMKRAAAIAPVTSLQPPYNIIRRGIEDEILPWCLENRIGVINYSPMASGLLSGKMSRERLEKMHPTDWRKKSNEFTDPRLSRNLKLQDLLGEIGSLYGRTAGETAIAWTLLNPAVTAAIAGMRRPDQVEGVIHAGEMNLSGEDVKRIADFIRDNP
jgi:aryl-alcohol dehydrogenase-like predicted oxidoreductase